MACKLLIVIGCVRAEIGLADAAGGGLEKFLTNVTAMLLTNFK